MCRYTIKKQKKKKKNRFLLYLEIILIKTECNACIIKQLREALAGNIIQQLKAVF